jgi:predicted nucleic acid-binding protein
MIMVDTSAWIEFLRDTGSSACNAVDQLLGSNLAICDVVSMEVFAGARDEQHLSQLRGLLARATVLPITSEDYEHAATLYRTCRRKGETVRKLIDCLIGAVAIRSNATLLHADQDFALLARHTALTLHSESTR